MTGNWREACELNLRKDEWTEPATNFGVHKDFAGKMNRQNIKKKSSAHRIVWRIRFQMLLRIFTALIIRGIFLG